ncbi:SGNH/GDSL hydrolase family protein [Myceligenerans pegani]|uniref:SGNH/GDSL hydrolase family protein n=1 Tax=Myceligenerans pegani TaxID=2776917 RepID=A0ABR9MUN4_9MICO|nr:SGNH/GDSL hydrolase family protein [Myceligenerans sp. TRM 65318]MBE1875099.1 SGNH/GDSL hydrolase family protein [Myceligenerans sp. TRM 65318]MBE3017370.1 SGNH/GDSL hydrolase family protein [Myceligenerans sp. TRM 65318]
MTAGPAVAVALGDSITVGVGDTVGPDARHGAGWAAHLATVLRVGRFRNLASNGSRARDVVGGQLTEALRLRPALATVLVGGNDVLRSDFSPREIESALARTVGALASTGSDVILVRLPVIGLFELAPRAVRRVMRRRVAVVNAAVDAAAAAARQEPGRVMVVDGAEAIESAGAGAWHIDRVHPSPAGHRKLALEVARAWLEEAPRTGSAIATQGGGAPSEALSAGAAASAPARSEAVSEVAPPLAALAARLPSAPDPPSWWQRAGWLVVKGIPWTWRRGGDFLPGLIRAVVSDLRSDQMMSPGSAIAGIADSGLDPRKRMKRRGPA